ncbi:MAG: CBS domain-containing protein [Acidimicrobiales bacterium]
MEIESLVTRAVLTVKPTDTLKKAAMAMMERGVGSAVVITGGKPSGIITDRDALRAIARGKAGGDVPVGELVAGKLTTVPVSTEVLEAARLMRDRGFRHLVVVDGEGRLAGVFSMRDLVVGLLAERDLPTATPS